MKLRKKILKLIESKKITQIQNDVKLIFGPDEIDYPTNEAIVLCLVKNGETWVKDFIEHYQRKDFKHIVFLDNGSKDKTIEIARNYKNITFLKTEVPFKNNNILLRRYLVNRFAKDRWSLNVDIDELWDYPYSDKVSLRQFLNYVKKSGANAVVAQMLDMFMEKIPEDKTVLSDYKYYDIESIKKSDFNKSGKFVSSKLTFIKILKKFTKLFKGGLLDKMFRYNNFNYANILNKDIKSFRGGIRKKVFGLDNVWLTKIPLIFYDDTVEPIVHQHFSNNIIIADISTTILHYKFTHDFKKGIEEAVKNKQYANNSAEYRKYLEKYEQDSDTNLKQSTSKRLYSIDKLVRDNFLVISNKYRNLF